MMYSDVYVVCATGGAGDEAVAHRARHGHRRHAHSAGAGGGNGDAKRDGAGRVFLGIGTGNTAMRTMGQKPMKIAAFAEYLRVTRGLLDGEVVDYAFKGGPAGEDAAA